VKKTLLASCFVSLTMVGCGKGDQKYVDIACSYAPSQSNLVSSLSSTAGGAAATTAGLAKALGLSVVTHSSGSLILTGASGYISGTLGAAIAGPAIITVGTVVGGSAVTLELLCSPQNHPEGYEAVLETSREFQQAVGARYWTLIEASSHKAQEALSISKDSLRVAHGRVKDLVKRVWD
jgi:hypothetical protein